MLNKINSVLVAVLGILFCISTYAQEPLYMPLEFSKAYDNGTRLPNGVVPESYWQNHSDYRMKVKINPKKKMLYGKADITYYNESPNYLEDIVFYTYHDYYRRGARRAGFFSSGDALLETDGMILDMVKINDQKINLEDYRLYFNGGTFHWLGLKDSIPSGGSIKLYFEWHYEIPGRGFERSGAIDPTSMFIGYWYPEIAVYDDINGWDETVYDASAEFYHDYSNYDVEIEVPKNYLVWASVEPNNAEEVYPQFIMDRLDAAAKVDTAVPIITESEAKKGVKMKSNVWKFTATRFPDFAFAISDHFVWDAATYSDEFGTYRMNAVYNSRNSSCKQIINTERESIKMFHYQFPKRKFPYSYFTVFNGLPGGGMEFPGMANNAAPSGSYSSMIKEREVNDFDATFGLTLHEMCHMYFPFYMGINEKNYAWMDEGWATFSEYFIEGEPNTDWRNNYLGHQENSPLMVPTYSQPEVSGTNSYDMGAFSYYSLYYLLGTETFDYCMKEYMDRWNHKHPTPYDFFNTFNWASGENLNWFWKNWYFDWGHPDVAITDFDDNVVTVENRGGKAMAFSIVFTFDDGTSEAEIISPRVWKSSSKYLHETYYEKVITEIRLRCILGHDAVYENDFWPPMD